MKYDPSKSLYENLAKLLDEHQLWSDELLFNSVVAKLKERDEAVKALKQPSERDTTPETRYVLHDTIKPCTVLYSDDTTTLIRLPEGDVMGETGSFIWATKLEYDCQELGKRVGLGKPSFGAALARLVESGNVTITDPVYYREENDNA